MARDYSKFGLPHSSGTDASSTLQTLGWQNFFAQQISTEELIETPPVRVMEVHRSGLVVLGDGLEKTIPPGPDATVGDWLLFDHTLPKNSRVLERKSLIKRRAAGHDMSVQLIAANIDTAFIVSSLNQDFNVARLERYVALAFEAEVDPVILLTKPDLCDDPAPYVAETQSISDEIPVVVLDARGDEPLEKLAQWCRAGQTVVFLGSSGVGKSTLTNALSGRQAAETQAIRDDDAKGRHTTRHRQLHIMPNGCAVLDTPGMRELQLTDAAEGVAEVFADLEELAAQCKFNDCAHETEPGCAVRAALEKGDIDEKRLTRWRKLSAEEAHNTASIAQRRSKDKAFGKMIKKVQKNSKK